MKKAVIAIKEMIKSFRVMKTSMDDFSNSMKDINMTMAHPSWQRQTIEYGSSITAKTTYDDDITQTFNLYDEVKRVSRMFLPPDIKASCHYDVAVAAFEVVFYSDVCRPNAIEGHGHRIYITRHDLRTCHEGYIRAKLESHAEKAVQLIYAQLQQISSKGIVQPMDACPMCLSGRAYIERDRKCKFYQSEENAVYHDVVRWVCRDCNFQGPLADSPKEAASLWDSLPRKL